MLLSMLLAIQEISHEACNPSSKHIYIHIYIQTFIYTQMHTMKEEILPLIA